MSDNTLIAIVMVAFFIFLSILAIKSPPTKLPERPCKIDHHEYQIELEFDTVLIYQDNRFVGSYIVTEPLSPIDSILGDDNR